MDYETWKKPSEPRATMWEVEYDWPNRPRQSTLATQDRVEEFVRNLAKQLRYAGGAIVAVRQVGGKDKPVGQRVSTPVPDALLRWTVGRQFASSPSLARQIPASKRLTAVGMSSRSIWFIERGFFAENGHSVS